MHNMKLNGQKMKDEYNMTPLNYPFVNSSYWYMRCIFGMYFEITYKPHGQLLYKGSSWLEKKKMVMKTLTEEVFFFKENNFNLPFYLVI